MSIIIDATPTIWRGVLQLNNQERIVQITLQTNSELLLGFLQVIDPESNQLLDFGPMKGSINNKDITLKHDSGLIINAQVDDQVITGIATFPQHKEIPVANASITLQLQKHIINLPVIMKN